MNQKERREQRKKGILEAAMHDFCEFGYESVSMENLSRRHKISKGTLYHYFQSKDEIFLACAKETFSQLQSYLENNQDKLSVEHGKESITSFFMLRETFFSTRPILMGIFEIAMIRPPKHLVGSITQIREPVQKMNHKFLREVLSNMQLREDLDLENVLAYLVVVEKYFWELLPKQELNVHDMFNQVGGILDMLLFGVAKQ